MNETNYRVKHSIILGENLGKKRFITLITAEWLFSRVKVPMIIEICM